MDVSKEISALFENIEDSLGKELRFVVTHEDDQIAAAVGAVFDNVVEIVSPAIIETSSCVTAMVQVGTTVAIVGGVAAATTVYTISMAPAAIPVIAVAFAVMLPHNW